MRKVLIFMMALTIGFLLGTNALGVAFRCYCDGNQYMALTYEFQAGYVAGVSDAFSNLGESEQLKLGIGYSKLIRNMTIKQIHAIVEKWMKEHPEEWHKAMSGIILVAVGESCLKHPPR